MSKNWLTHIVLSPIEAMTEESLSHLTGDELESVCLLLGIPHSGSKSEQIGRILIAKELRMELARWVHSELKSFDSKACIQAAQVMQENYKGKQLKELCKKAKVYAPSTNSGMCSSLIKWVLDCRRRGQQFYEEQLAIAKERRKNKPKQLQLFPVHSPDFMTAAQRSAAVTVPQKKPEHQQQTVAES